MAPSAVTDTWVATMLSAKHTHAVRSLDLSDACNITSESLAAIADTCPKFVCVWGICGWESDQRKAGSQGSHRRS